MSGSGDKRTNGQGAVSREGGDVRCTHCALPVPFRLVRPGDEHQFCCEGCRSVYEVIHGWGYEKFYAMRKAEGADGQPASVSGRRFEDFDDEGFQRDHVRSTATGTQRTSLYLEGVHCAACVWLVERLPSVSDGLLSVRLNISNAQAEVEWDPEKTSLSAVGQALDRIGYTPHPYRAGELGRIRRREDRALLVKLGVAAACALNIMVIHGALYAGEASGMEPAYEAFFRWISFGLALPVVLFSARPFYVAAWSGLRQRVPHMDLPVSIALLGAFGFSAYATVSGTGHIYFDSLTALVALLLGARYVQRRAQRAALERSEGLRAAAFVEFARRLDGDTSREVPVGALAKGERVEVRSGELVPVDGVVVDGRSAVNNAVLTGEPEPQPVAPGAEVHAGTTNLGARLVVEVRAAGEETRVGALLRLVDEAMSRRAPIVETADRLSRYFVTVLLSLAALTGAFWLWREPGVALDRVVALLVVSCPCALGLATPVAISVGLAKAARRGIFIKQSAVIEMLRNVATALLDKTGTLTRGEARVGAWEGSSEVATLVATLERQSDHPVATALRRELGEGGSAPVSEVAEVAGRGIAGRVGERHVVAGNRAHLAAHGVSVDVQWEQRAAELTERSLSPVFVAVDGGVLALAGVGDPLRPDAAGTVQALRGLGWRPVVLSGDHPAVVQGFARQLAIPAEDAHGAMTPEGKRDYVQALRDGSGAGGGRILMVGDGVNDAAALALADIGVSVHGGSGASVVAADVVLTREGLAPILELAEGARGTLRVIYRNLGFSLVYNLVGAALAVVGLVGPLLAAVLMPMSSLTVILSSVVGRSFSGTSPAAAAKGG